ncbi:hypothetical protein FC41_GL000504 [Lactobacillus hominis DSM 23910 = CRBIP 24.179]|nr:hypothetical protein FC41_GL000504 [Lactobacillus hominis DSM 23910 = CRBIP 24.179]MCT3347822.1 zinc-ribbon domain-containing protein [Lactobacillus hominis]
MGVRKVMDKKFCPNCGKPIKEDTQFCPNCGAEIKQEVKPAVSQKQTNAASPAVKAPMSKKKKWSLITGIVLVAVIVILVAVGNNVYSKDKQVSHIVYELTNKNGDAASVIKPADDSVKVTKSSAKATQQNFEKLSSNRSDIENALTMSGQYQNYKLVQDGHKWLIFPNYKLEVPTYNPQVNTNHSNSELFVDGKKQGKFVKSGDMYSCKMDPVMEGTHKIEVRSKIHGRSLKAVSNQNINSNSEVDLAIKTGTFKVKGIPNADVYINDEKVGKLNKDGIKTFEDYPLTNGMTLYVKTKLDGKTVTSETIKNLEVDADGSTDYKVEPQFAGSISKDDAERLLTDQLNTDEPDADAFVGGKDSKAYHLIADALKKISDMDGFIRISNCDVKVSDLHLSASDETTVNFTVTYDFDFEDKTNHQVNEWDGCVIKNVGTQDDPEYKIKDLGKYKLIKSENEDD